jgi:hypothetical protein
MIRTGPESSRPVAGTPPSTGGPPQHETATIVAQRPDHAVAIDDQKILPDLARAVHTLRGAEAAELLDTSTRDPLIN